MEEILAALAYAFGEICCQMFAAFGADIVAAFAAYMSGREDSQHRKGWRAFFWAMLPIAVVMTMFVLFVLLTR